MRICVRYYGVMIVFYMFYGKRRVTEGYIKWRGLEEDRYDENMNIDWVKVYECSDWGSDKINIVIWMNVVFIMI